jgi:predicted Zn-ribbon and HTH transcriptional regulator
LSITIDDKLGEAIRALSKEMDIPVSHIIEMGMKFLFEHSELLKQALNNRVQRGVVEKEYVWRLNTAVALSNTKAVSGEQNMHAVIQCRSCGYVLAELAGINNIMRTREYVRKLNMRCPRCKSDELIMIIK